MQQRLQKCISEAGVASRRAAETMISAGRVTVNGQTAQLGAQADPETDVICIDGRPLPSRAPKRYIMLNKPRGYVTTMHDEHGRKTVADLVASLGERLYPVGRLDLDSEGLLILTNDGEIANCLMHPSHEIPKTYEVDVAGGDLAVARRHGAGGLSRPPGGGDGARTRAAVRDDPRGTQPAGAPPVRARGAARPAARARGGGGAAPRHTRAAPVASAVGCGGRLPEIASLRRKILCKFSTEKLQKRLAKWLEFA